MQAPAVPERLIRGRHIFTFPEKSIYFISRYPVKPRGKRRAHKPERIYFIEGLEKSFRRNIRRRVRISRPVQHVPVYRGIIFLEKRRESRGVLPGFFYKIFFLFPVHLFSVSLSRFGQYFKALFLPSSFAL